MSDPTRDGPAVLSEAAVAEIEERASKATPGPWTTATGAHPSGDDKLPYVLTDPDDPAYARLVPQNLDNCRFVAAARADIPALVASHITLTAALARCVAALQWYAQAEEAVAFDSDGEEITVYDRGPERAIAALNAPDVSAISAKGVTP